MNKGKLNQASNYRGIMGTGTVLLSVNCFPVPEMCPPDAVLFTADS